MSYVQSGTYAPGEVPEYSFLEGVTAGPHTKWHIRKVAGALHLGGGIDTPSLCDQVRPIGPDRGAIGGWDLNIKITEHHLGHSCPKCVELYKKAIGT
jgi:hypothetical protein